MSERPGVSRTGTLSSLEEDFDDDPRAYLNTQGLLLHQSLRAAGRHSAYPVPPEPVTTPEAWPGPDQTGYRRPGLRRRASSAARRRSLDAVFDPRHNHLSTIRLVLALVVAFAHAMQLGFGHQPVIGVTGIGELAVDAFFVLSGYLLVGSYLRLWSIRRYVWHRFLRIMPGFWVCLVFTAFLIAPLVAWIQSRPPTSVFSGPESSFDFVLHDVALMMRQFGVAGLPQDVAVPGVLNGSLWTLFYEALCYAGVVGLGVIGALRWRPALTLAVVAVLWAAIALNSAGLVAVHQQRVLRFLLMFLLGSAMFLYARRVPIRARYAVASLAVVVPALLWTTDYRVLGAPAFAYLCLWCVVTRPPRTTPRSDFSYGLYAYHWPILQVLVVAGLPAYGVAPLVVVGLCAGLGLAYLSWHLIERPALHFKDAVWVNPRVRGPRHRSME